MEHRVGATDESYLRSLTWEQKVASVVRMNNAAKIARQAMREATQNQSVS